MFYKAVVVEVFREYLGHLFSAQRIDVTAVAPVFLVFGHYRREIEKRHTAAESDFLYYLVILIESLLVIRGRCIVIEIR